MTSAAPQPAPPSRLPDLLLAGALLFYLLCALTQAHTAPLYSDDYLNCGTLCQLVYATPYHDFVPWNNLLGHYIQLPALLLYPDPVLGPIAVRMELACLSFLFLSLAAWRLRKEFSTQAVFLGVLSVALMDFFVWNTVAVRLDGLSAWAGFAALLLALRDRWKSAGFFCAVAFMISHKAIYHFAAFNCALFALLLLAERWPSTKRALRFNLTALTGTGLYYLVVHLLWKTGNAITRHNETKLQTLEGFYHTHGLLELSLRYVFLTNWFFTALALAGIALTIRQMRRLYRNEEFRQEFRSATVLAVYFLSIIGLCGLHPHPFAYFWIILMPGFWYLFIKTADTGLRYFRARTGEQQISAICVGGALILLLAGLWIPRYYWTTSFFLWMCLVIPTAMAVLCLPLYWLARYWSRVKPACLPGLFLFVLIPIVFFASTWQALWARMTHQAQFNQALAEMHFTPKLEQLRAYLRKP